MSTLALTRQVSASIGDCALSHIERAAIDVDRAREQHRRYEQCLRTLGCRIERLPAADELPDAVFVEDAAVVFDEIAVMGRSAETTRRAETKSVAAVLGRYRGLTSLEAPCTLDGGDVLVVDRTVFVGLSDRTNAPAVTRLHELLGPFGYEVRAVKVAGCLHLKSAVTQVAPKTILVQPEWIDMAPFDGLKRIQVDIDEPYAANALLVGDSVLYPEQFPATRRLMERQGITIVSLDASELAKAEGALTCCSILLDVED